MNSVIQLNVRSIAAMRPKQPARYEVIRLDTNNDCNLHCVYCHNRRSNELLELDEFRSFLAENVLGTSFFQVGCGMEPTLDPRMCDFMQAIAASVAKPVRVFRLQTNGILLHRHDHQKMVDAGLNLITVSIDSINPEQHKALRDGTSLSKVQRNIRTFIKSYPSVKIRFITTITTVNIDDIDDLINWGIDHGVEGIELRQMFHDPDSRIVDHGKMEALTVTNEEFSALQDRISDEFTGKATLFFNSIENSFKVAAETALASR